MTDMGRSSDLRELTDARRVIARAMTEDELKTNVLSLCRALKVLAVHFRPARTKYGWRTPVEGTYAKGFPDLVIAFAGRVLFVELKRQDGKSTVEQDVWATHLGDLHRLWRPSHWMNGEIEREIRRLAGI